MLHHSDLVDRSCGPFNEDDCHLWIQFSWLFYVVIGLFGFICFGVVSLFVFGTLIDKKGERCTPVNFGLVLFEFGLKLWTLYFLRGSFLCFHVFDYLCWLVLFRRGSFYLVITNLFSCRSVILILPSKVPKGEIVKSQSWDLFPYWEYVIYWHFWKVPKLILYILIIYLFPV